MRGNKRVIRAVLDAQAELGPETERELIELRGGLLRSEDFREGVRAFAEKRPPRWQGQLSSSGRSAVRCRPEPDSEIRAADGSSGGSWMLDSRTA